MTSNKLIQDVVGLIESNIIDIAIGTGAEPIPSDTTLDGETIRKSATTYIDDNTVISELYIDENEGNDINFTNTGVFDSLQLYAGGRIDEQKNATESLTISIEITVEGV